MNKSGGVVPQTVRTIAKKLRLAPASVEAAIEAGGVRHRLITDRRKYYCIDEVMRAVRAVKAARR